EGVGRGKVGVAGSVGELADGAAALLQTSAREHAGHLGHMLWNTLFVASKPLFVGTTIVGTVAGVATYFVALGAIREIRHLRHLSHPSRPTPGEAPVPPEARR